MNTYMVIYVLTPSFVIFEAYFTGHRFHILVYSVCLSPTASGVSASACTIILTDNSTFSVQSAGLQTDSVLYSAAVTTGLLRLQT